jgi:chromate reductase, NAD(P)H dehydrogenase (quinone)
LSHKKIQILAVCGSLRQNSANIQVINYVASLVPPHVSFDIYEHLAGIPPFDDGEPNDAVLDWRKRLREADGIFICTPEYAFGVSGVLKNALDWTVSSADMDGKPISLVTAATGGERAHAALQLTLNVISGNSVLPEATLLISFIRAKMNKEGQITDEATAIALKAAIDSFIRHIEAKEQQ